MLKELNDFEQKLEKKFDGVVDELNAASDKIYYSIAKANTKDLQNSPLNKILFSIIFLITNIITLAPAIDLIKGAYWQQISGNISYFNVETIDSVAGSPTGPYDYRASVRYTYRFNGKLYSGDNFHPNSEVNIFNKLSEIDFMVPNKSPGEEIKIYVDPNRPWISSIHSGGISIQSFLQLMGLLMIYLFVLIYSSQYLKIL